MTSGREPAGRPLDAPLLTFDLRTSLAQVKAERTWQTANRNAITLLKTHGLRVVLVAMHAGTAIPVHDAEGAITVQVVEGRLLFTAGAQEVVLDPGQLLTLQSRIAHGLEAVGDCAFLLTIGGGAAHPVE